MLNASFPNFGSFPFPIFCQKETANNNKLLQAYLQYWQVALIVYYSQYTCANFYVLNFIQS